MGRRRPGRGVRVGPDTHARGGARPRDRRRSHRGAVDVRVRPRRLEVRLENRDCRRRPARRGDVPARRFRVGTAGARPIPPGLTGRDPNEPKTNASCSSCSRKPCLWKGRSSTTRCASGTACSRSRGTEESTGAGWRWMATTRSGPTRDAATPDKRARAAGYARVRAEPDGRVRARRRADLLGMMGEEEGRRRRSLRSTVAASSRLARSS